MPKQREQWKKENLERRKLKKKREYCVKREMTPWGLYMRAGLDLGHRFLYFVINISSFQLTYSNAIFLGLLKIIPLLPL